MILLTSLFLALFQFSFVFAAMDFDTSKYKESKCYKEYQEVVSKQLAKKSKQREKALETRRLGFNPSLDGLSDESKEQKLLSVAHYNSQSHLWSEKSRFQSFFTQIQKDYPEVSKQQVQSLVHKGFISGTFCDHWFFSGRFNTKQAIKYVKKELKNSKHIATDRDFIEKEQKVNVNEEQSATERVNNE